MRKTSVMVAACATLLCAGVALATPTAQQKCDYARITAWKVFRTCVDRVVAKDATGVLFDEYAAYAKCRHTYFKKWTAFQPKTALAFTTCIGTRYRDNGDQTVTDNLSGLVWEKKDNSGGIHDRDDVHTLSTGAPFAGNGTAYTSFLSGATGLNTLGFAGANDWRLPKLAELQSIVLDFACTGAASGPTCSCPSFPCVAADLDPANTLPDFYWSATTILLDTDSTSAEWFVSFANGDVGGTQKSSSSPVRAVRGGL